MFGKSKPPKDQLSARVRALSAPPAPAQTAAPSAPYSHKREAPRNPRDPVFRSATLLLNEKERFAVVIKNLSATGARVEYFTKVELPPIVVLVESTLRLRQRARVVWQRDGVAGLEFIR